MRKKKYSLSIGIPAYNEEGNIGYLIESILRQKNTIFEIKEILVICDGCTDKTAKIARSYSSKSQKITVIERRKRTGKALALNYLYEKQSGEFFFQPDADVVLGGDNDLEEMVKIMAKDKKILLVSPRHIAVEGDSIWSKFAYYSYSIFADAAMDFNDGYNTYTTMGASLIRSSFLKNFSYPLGIIGDQTYLFASAVNEDEKGYGFARKAHVYFRTVGTFQEWRKLGIRSVGEDKNTVIQNFDKDIIRKFYQIPKTLYFHSLAKYFSQNPFYASGAILMEVFIRAFPLGSQSVVQAGTWEPNTSSKIGIKLRS